MGEAGKKSGAEENILVHFPPAEYHRLQWYCIKTNVPVEQVIRDFVRHGIDEAVQRALGSRRRTMGDLLARLSNPFIRRQSELEATF